jgi:hypothetical protein
MATFTVTTVRDTVSATDGKLSLREAVARANATAAADTIVFGSKIEGKTLVLTRGDLEVTRDLAIDGDRNDDGVRITLSGGDASGILSIVGTSENRLETSISGVNFKGANDAAIAAYYGRLNIDNSDLSGNNGKAIYLEEFGLDGSHLSIRDNDDGGVWGNYANVAVEDSVISGNGGAGISTYGAISVLRSNVSNNSGSGIVVAYNPVVVIDSTIANNVSSEGGGGIQGYPGFPNWVTIINSTVTGNRATGGSDGGGVFLDDGGLYITNSIIAGNSVRGGGSGADIAGVIDESNGHNVFGSDVLGSVTGDVENVAPGVIFAAVDTTTGGGKLDPATGTVPLKAGANPALGGASLDAAGTLDQLGNPRPEPGDTAPDIGAVESAALPSATPTAYNDLVTGTAAAETIDGLAGQDTIKGLGGADTLRGSTGDDRLEGGAGNDRLQGGAGFDRASYRDGATAVTVDLRGDGSKVLDTARRGTETDTLTGIEGAIGGSGDDRFFGDVTDNGNWFQGGGGKDIYTGGLDGDIYVFNLTSASAVGSRRDVITDFTSGGDGNFPTHDTIDLRGIDADVTLPGNQGFSWVDTAALTGPGEVGYYVSGGNTIIRMSTDADAAAESEIQLSGDIYPWPEDFYF